MDQTVLQVSDFLALTNQTLEYAYPSVLVEGEVASFKISKGKFVFFDLKDQSGLVNCFMMIYGLRQPFEDGMRVRVLAQPRVTDWGKFSLTVREVLPVGQGSIKRALQLLKQKLEKEGLFDERRKRVLPYLPERVGVVSSIESAGYADFIKILNQRWGGVSIFSLDVQVQGGVAVDQIIGAINYFNQSSDPPEAIAVLRGGGSAEDLSAFNDELLVRAIAASRVPIIVGVGHEIDTTLADLAADVRAATPSNAAQILFPDKNQFAREVDQKQKRLLDIVQNEIKRVRITLHHAVEKMNMDMELSLEKYYVQIKRAESLLKQLNPNLVLQRGYSLVRNKGSKIVKKVEDVSLGETIEITSSRAIITAGVVDVREK